MNRQDEKEPPIVCNLQSTPHLLHQLLSHQGPCCSYQWYQRNICDRPPALDQNPPTSSGQEDPGQP